MITLIPSPTWQPAAVRVLPIVAPANLRTRGLVPEIITLSWAPKSSADHFDFSLDLSAILDATGDHIAAIEHVEIPVASGLPTQLAVLCSSIVNGLACIMLGGGAPGETDEIVVYVVTQQGRRLAPRILLTITTETDASIPTPAPTMSGGVPVPPNAIRLPGGLILTDDNGNLS
ncbi:phage fiber-tail adaptor protein [Acetobacter indonesiensis]|uniref:Uncharacterized protein n=1 Tax=Acetobacter indonesiensis TaxID=104101 RepID=A0A252AMB3_9PROT|nr:hypothetical protein [Acetobacter indonesiensis]OUI90822.1 hypothetical protein HK17_13170 [Acetobacter indonesiensis]GAN64718.1 hypothetical protein Abin_213_004 [Acetobacter indonesiensis]GEN04916.1 hypothetical protein AIN02nite_29410 [Acetobacter indonesiensis]